MILIEVDQAFFDIDEDRFEEKFTRELHREVSYLNLNVRQSILLFREDRKDCRVIASQVYTFLKRNYRERFHLAVSRRFGGHEELPKILSELEHWQESRYFLIEEHILSSVEDDLAFSNEEAHDSKITQKILSDVIRKDAFALRRDFEWLERKYEGRTQYSSVYTKFVFASVVEQIYRDQIFAQGHNLREEIVAIYSSRTLPEMIGITRRNVEAYMAYLDEMERVNRDQVEHVVTYIETHYAEDLGTENLAAAFALDAGYLTVLFRRVTGYNLNHYIHGVRMHAAGELLGEGNSCQSAAGRSGFQSVLYFQRAYRQFFGTLPEDSDIV
jgi:two-component system response regulator YesN